MIRHRMGVIGYGDMGKWHIEQIKARIPELQVKGVYDIKPEKGAQAVANGLVSFSTADELLLDKDIDLVLVTTPNNFHADYSIRAMQANKSVVCEKPVCLNSEELSSVLSVSEQTKKVFTVHQNRRWDIDFAVVRKTLADGVLGKPYFIDSRLYGSKGLPGDWRSSVEAGGGMLYDWASHLIDQILQLVKAKPLRVFCQLKSVKFTDVDDCDRIIIEFDNGVSAQIVVDSWCYISEPRWHVSADDGTLIVNNWFSGEGKIIKANIKEINWESGVIFTKSGRTKTMAPRPKEDLKELSLPKIAEPRWEEFYENVMDVMENKASLIVTAEHQVTLMKILDACKKSGETHALINL